MADVQTVLDKWTRNMTGSIPSIKAGVMAVQVAPTQKAAAAAQLYAQKVAEAVASGRFQAALNAVSLQDWQNATVNKGTQRIAAGVQAAQQKVSNFLAQALPYTASVKQRIAQMPKGTDADSDARMLAAVNMMRQFKYQRRTA